MVGVSPNIMRPSDFAMKYLKTKGYRIIPINPAIAGQQLMGEPVYASLREVPHGFDMVDIFRNSLAAGKISNEAIELKQSKGIKVIERKIKPNEMKDFVGCFLTGTAAEVTPVSQIDKYKFTVCNVIKNLSESYQDLVRKKTAA